MGTHVVSRIIGQDALTSNDLDIGILATGFPTPRSQTTLFVF
jgi:hypothetical protein